MTTATKKLSPAQLSVRFANDNCYTDADNYMADVVTKLVEESPQHVITIVENGDPQDWGAYVDAQYENDTPIHLTALGVARMAIHGNPFYPGW